MSFDTALAEVLKTEAGFTDDSVDHGGATNYGITAKTLSDFLGREVSADDVRNLDMETVRKIYRQNYWDRLALDGVNSPAVAYFLFDQAVNRGCRRVAEEIQSLVGAKTDGVLGPKSLAAINAREPRRLLVDLIKSAQISYAKICRADPDQSKFIVGWIGRTHKFLDSL